MFALALPVVLSEIGWMAMSIVDTIMVGRMGAAAIGAVAVGNAAYYAPSLFGIGLMLGLDTLVSQAWGRGDHDDCHGWLAQGIYLCLLATLPLMLLLAAIARALPLAGIHPAVAGPAQSYLEILSLGTLPLLVYAAARRYLQGVGQVRVIATAYVTANLINWAGNWALIYGRLGLPRLGVAGSAVSTVLSRLWLAAMLMVFAWAHERRRGHPLFRHWPGMRLKKIAALCRLGAPAAGQIVMEVGAFGTATILAGRLAPAALAAHQIALNSASLTYMVPLGVSAAAAVSVGHAVGAGDAARARRAGWIAIALAAGFMALAMMAFLLFPRAIIRIYAADPEVLHIGPVLLAIAGGFQIFDGLQTVSTGALRGLGETRVPMVANFAGYWLFGLPLGAWLCFARGRGVYGLWAGLTAALVIISLVLLRQWARRSRRLRLPGQAGGQAAA